MAEQHKPNVFHISDPNLFTYIQETSFVEKSAGLPADTKIFIFTRPIYIQLSRFPGLMTQHGIRKIKMLNLDIISLNITQYIENLDNMLRDHFQEQFSGGRRYKSLFFPSRGEQESRMDLDVKNARFFIFGEGDDIKMVNDPHKIILPNSMIVPVVILRHIFTSRDVWGAKFVLKDCFVIPAEPKRKVEPRPLFDLGDRSVPVIPPLPPVLEAPRNDEICTVCLNTQIDIVFLPCGHFCTCSSCSQRCRNCPVCRGAITRMVNWRHISEDVRVFRV